MRMPDVPRGANAVLPPLAIGRNPAVACRGSRIAPTQIAVIAADDHPIWQGRLGGLSAQGVGGLPRGPAGRQRRGGDRPSDDGQAHLEEETLKDMNTTVGDMEYRVTFVGLPSERHLGLLAQLWAEGIRRRALSAAEVLGADSIPALLKGRESSAP